MSLSNVHKHHKVVVDMKAARMHHRECASRRIFRGKVYDPARIMAVFRPYL